MTRIIKFRALVKKMEINPNFDKWVKETGKRGRDVFEEDTGEKFNLGDRYVMDYDVCVSSNGKMMCLESGWDYHMDDEEALLMQFTGLKDKNGKEIFEGDIVKGTCSKNPHYVCQGLQEYDEMGKQIIGIIRYCSSFAMYYFTTNDITFLDLKLGILDIEIIGNIHQNPELLDKTK